MSSILSKLINLAGNITGTLPAVNGGLATDASGFSGVVKASTGAFSAATVVNADVSSSAAIAGSKIVSASGATAGVVDANAQTFNGAKTFASAVVVGGNTTSDANLGTITTVSFGSYYSGTFLLSFTGFASISNQTFYYTLIGKTVTLMWPDMQATSGGAGTLAATATVPTALKPAQDFNFLCLNKNSGSPVVNPGVVAITASGGIITYTLSITTSNYAASGSCGPYSGCMTYRVT